MRGATRSGLWREVAAIGERKGSERAQIASVATGSSLRAGVHLPSPVAGGRIYFQRRKRRYPQYFHPSVK